MAENLKEKEQSGIEGFTVTVELSKRNS